MHCDVDLLVTADVGSDGSDPDVTGEAEEGQEDEEDGSLEDGRLQDGMIGVVDPGVTNADTCGLGSGVGAMGVDHELQGLIVALLVGHVGLQSSNHTFSGRKVPCKACLKKIPNRQLKMP
jgi:hypothetical protein